MTSEDGDLYPLTQEEAQGKNNKTKNCYLPPSGGWFSGQVPPDPVAEGRKWRRLAWFNSKRPKRQADQRLDETPQEPSYPPPGWEFDR